MKDVCKRELHIGDTVVTHIDGYTYALVVCKVVAFTKCKVKLGGYNKDDTCYKFPVQVCKTVEETL